MVWQYEEFSGCPYLTDWDRKQFKFSVEAAETLTGIREKELDIFEGEIIPQTPRVFIFESDGVLRPLFYMAGEKAIHAYTLKMGKLEGLVRQPYLQAAHVGDLTVIKGAPDIGVGDFNDFKNIGQYAVDRLSKIAQEIVSPPKDCSADIPEDSLESSLKYRKSCLLRDWVETQRQICQEFYTVFTIYAQFEVTDAGLKSRKDKLSPVQIKELHALVLPLKSE